MRSSPSLTASLFSVISWSTSFSALNVGQVGKLISSGGRVGVREVDRLSAIQIAMCQKAKAARTSSRG